MTQPLPFELLYEHLPFGVTISKVPDLTIVYANKFIEDLYKNPREKFVNVPLPLLGIVSQDDEIELFLKELKDKKSIFKFVEFSIFGTPINYHCIFTWIEIDGTPYMQTVFNNNHFQEEINKQKLRTELAERTNAMLQQEIKERISLLKKLEESQNYTRNIIDSSLDMIIATDKNSLIIEFNEAAQFSFGYTFDEIENKHISILFHSYDQFIDFESNLKRSGTYTGEVQAVRSNKEVFASYFSTTILSNSIGDVIGLMAVARDVTDVKKAHLELLNKEERYRTIFNTAFSGIARVDVSGNFLEVNKSFIDIFGFNPIDENIKYWDLIYNQKLKEKNFEILALLTEGSITKFSAEFKFKGRSRSEIFASVSISFIKDIKNEIAYFLYFFEDKTDIKLAELKLKESLHEKEVLLQEIHHRVKNNLQVISSILNLQGNYIENPQLAKALKESQGRISSMAYIHELLYQNKDFTKINFSQYIENLTSKLIYSFSEYPNLLKYQHHGSPININLDYAIPCGLIINELITNILKYAFKPNQPGEIYTAISQNGKQIHIEISDNGIGFPENIDFQNSPSLGLQLVTGLVDQIDGNISMKSQQNIGTQFFIKFDYHTKSRTDGKI
jgi:PAS domain S-box-containing protein